MRAGWYLPVGAAGYVLSSAFPYDWATSVGALLTGLGWFFFGRDRGDAVMMITGVLLISSAAGASSASAAISPAGPPSEGAMLTVALLGAAFLAALLLEVVCLFRAARASRLIRWAAYVRVASLAALVAGSLYVAASALSVLGNMTPGQLANMTPEEVASLAEGYSWPVEAAAAVAAAANLLAAGGFISLWRSAGPPEPEGEEVPL